MDRTNESKKRAVLELQYVTHILYAMLHAQLAFQFRFHDRVLLSSLLIMLQLFFVLLDCHNNIHSGISAIYTHQMF